MGNYQLPSRITFYPSYPLYAYASGLLNATGNIEGLFERSIYDLISLNPSNIKSFANTENEFVKFNIDGQRTSDFFMTLGHNFKDISQSLTLTENDIDDYLALSNNPPDLLIRTGGDHRLSNFMLWQLAYTELFFLKKLWPDFNSLDLKKIILKYKNIKRNFGSL